MTAVLDAPTAPPQDVAAERAVLGAMLTSSWAIAQVSEVVRGPDFYIPQHELVFEAILSLYASGSVVDPITVSDELRRCGLLGRLGGSLLPELYQYAGPAASAEFHARLVVDRAVLRRVIEAGVRITQLGHQTAAPSVLGPNDAIDCVAQAQSAVEGLDTRAGSRAEGARQVMLAAIEAAEAAASSDGTVGLKSGIPELDRVIGGFRPGEVTVIAARPGGGKSVLGLDFARAAAFGQGGRAVLFSLEMSATEIGARLIAACTSTPLTALRTGHLTTEQWQRVGEYVDSVDDQSLLIDDSANLSIADIRSRARQYAHQSKVDLIVVDYLQLMSAGPGRRAESRQVEVAEFSRGLKLLAKELSVPVIALSQFNRAPEGRHDGKPRLSDMRESGAIEQDCDIAILLHRPDDDSPRVGEIDLIVAKNRNGPTTTITAAWQGHLSRIAPISVEEDR